MRIIIVSLTYIFLSSEYNGNSTLAKIENWFILREYINNESYYSIQQILYCIYFHNNYGYIIIIVHKDNIKQILELTLYLRLAWKLWKT